MPLTRVVVKVGSSSIADASGSLSDSAMRRLVTQLATIAATGVEPILVTSGAIASGRGAVTSPPRHDVSELQALAAVGQGLLMARYQRLFAEHGRVVGQVLFAGHDFGARQAYLNARNTLERLLEWGVIPIVNENDTTATEEISLGENDRLAALIATMLKADLLVILTDTPGIFSADPHLTDQASLIEEVAEVDAQLEAVAGDSTSGIGTGGMASKIAAAKLASWSGVTCVIADANEPDVIARAVAGDAVGTRVRARSPGLAARKVWIAFALRAAGRVIVDSGAADALGRGGSLLPVGIIDIRGDFEAGAAVEVVTSEGNLIAKGLAQSPSSLLRTICGSRVHELPSGTPTETIHRDDLVLMQTATSRP